MPTVCTLRLSRHMPQDMRLKYITREKGALTNILRCRVGVTTVEKKDKSIETLGQQYNIVEKSTVILATYVSKAIHYFLPSLVAIVRGIKSLMRIGFLYYNCLRFGLVLWLQDDFIPNTV